MQKRILINIGNTHTQIALADDGQVRLLEQVDTADIKVLAQLPILEKMPVAWRASAVCVVPLVRELLHKRYGEAIRFLSCEDFPQIDFSAVDTTTLGMDRIANAAAAYALAGEAVAVIDFGTCINTVVIDGKGRFLGGAILPGRMLLRKALSTYTAQLPFLPMRNELPAAIGANTMDAMAAGVDLGCIGTVRELVISTRKIVGGSCRFITAGGDAPYFLANLPELEKGPDLLTLRGVALARSE